MTEKSSARPGPRHSRRIMAAPSGREAHQIGPRAARGILAAVSALTLIAGGVGYSAIGNLNNELAQAGDLNLGREKDGATDILLVGIDSRTDAQGKPLSQQEIDMLRAGDEAAANTDTMILIRVPNDGSSATAVSLPRDTYVSTPHMGNMKLNGVYGEAKKEKNDQLAQQGERDEHTRDTKSTEAGRQALISSVADLTGITVDHYAEIGLLGFVLLTDAVGGVDVCLNQPVDEPLSGAKFPAGRQTLNGPDALSFVRQRHELPRGDLDRITRQQAYMASLANHILSSKTLTDPGSLGRINSAVQRSVVLDKDWDVMGLAGQMQNLTGGNVQFQTIPVTSIDGTGDYGESIVTVDRDQVHNFFHEMLGTKDGSGEAEPSKDSSKENIPKFKAADYKVNVLNAGEVAGLATRVADLTTGYGYTAGDVGNAPNTGVSESQINAKDVKDPAARALARQLGGLKVVQDPTLGAREINVTLSGTYKGPGVTEGAADKLKDPNDPEVGKAAEKAAEQQPADTPGGSPGAVVGTPGTEPPEQQLTKPIDAGGNGPRCVN
ncbi:LCP family protein [Corynebacterium heidelbergense]|uniref:LytR family transcriptional regulator n=1 Tax=Corynebacterium heidelbergense TaxID=2055947 RepID=A0A364V595_9CORY|nr:LCP family protein [Corynebacterium heidelbergense]RAV31791.1 LytR family transcriptional regulator [Corynebacterium heidelbergense]